MDKIVERLNLEPALAWKVAVNVLGAGEDSVEARRTQAEVRNAPLVRSLIENCDRQHSPYKKWNGAHWVLYVLSDLGYPPGDGALRPLMNEVFDCWLSQTHLKKHVRVIDGRVRRCASQEGNTVRCSLQLGFADERTDELVNRLLKWQWPDGGWNCDKRPEADSSSFMETLIPLRALALYAKITGDANAQRAVERAAEVFLTRRLFMRCSDGQVIDPHFLLLHYPCYWHYDILCGLKALAEAGFIDDPRCTAALDLLESQRLPDGGFPAEESFSRSTRPGVSGYSPVDWGGIRRKTMNPFVTADALYVLRMAGRWQPG